MQCPTCHIPLIVVEREGIEIDWCLDCRGLWFDEGELQLLGAKAGRSLEAEDLGRRPGDEVVRGARKCPRCKRTMERLLLEAGSAGDVEVDRCDDHGFWLDRGELGRIMRGRRPSRETDEGLMLDFLGETFDVQGAPAGAGALPDEETRP